MATVIERFDTQIVPESQDGGIRDVTKGYGNEHGDAGGKQIFTGFLGLNPKNMPLFVLTIAGL
jgi:hypothetical protein